MARALKPVPHTFYEELTDGLRRPLRVAELVHEARGRFPDLFATRTAEGAFVAEVLSDPRSGFHLIDSMARPRAEALTRLSEFQSAGKLELGPVRVDRRGSIGQITFQNHASLNGEDDDSTRAMEIAVDLILLDDAIEVGVLRGAAAVHPKHAGRRIFGSGLNMTDLAKGRISLAGFMVERELAAINKMYRGHEGREKPWIAAVESFAIGGACQWLLVMDRVIAETDSYFSLPAATREGLIPGCAPLRLPRLVGERLARQAIQFGRPFQADSPEGRLLADEVVAPRQISAAVKRAAKELVSAGPTSLTVNRRALREAQEPLDLFRRYMSTYAADQARCLDSPQLAENLKRNWVKRERAAAT